MIDDFRYQSSVDKLTSIGIEGLEEAGALTVGILLKSIWYTGGINIDSINHNFYTQAPQSHCNRDPLGFGQAMSQIHS